MYCILIISLTNTASVKKVGLNPAYRGLIWSMMSICIIDMDF